jgi:hypothetical protein
MAIDDHSADPEAAGKRADTLRLRRYDLPWEAMGMSAKSRATQHRQWAVNAIVAATQSASWVDQEVLFMIAQKHLTRAQKADHTRNPEPDGLPGRAKSRPTGQ